MNTANDQKRRRELRINRTKKLFIEATQSLIQEDGFHNLSIRKLADVTGYASATLYSYFSDFDELIIFASIKYRREYLIELSREVRAEMGALLQYRKVYEVFNNYSFASPALFMNMYFGSHADQIEEYFEKYYRLYPEEETMLPEFLYAALKERNLFRCDVIFARRLADEGHILYEHVNLISNLLVRLQETFLYEMTIRPGLDPVRQNEKFLEMFDHVIAMSAPHRFLEEGKT
jgi:AcrR family transcriptional regulator